MASPADTRHLVAEPARGSATDAPRRAAILALALDVVAPLVTAYDMCVFGAHDWLALTLVVMLRRYVWRSPLPRGAGSPPRRRRG